MVYCFSKGNIRYKHNTLSAQQDVQPAFTKFPQLLFDLPMFITRKKLNFLHGYKDFMMNRERILR